MPNPAEDGKGKAPGRAGRGGAVARSASSKPQLATPRSPTEAILVAVSPAVCGGDGYRRILGELTPYATGRRLYLCHPGGAGPAWAQEAAAALGLSLDVLSVPGDVASAIRYGMEEAVEDHLAVLDGDGQSDPRVLDALFAELRSGIDVAVASSTAPGAVVPAGSPHRRVTTALLRLCIRLLVPCRGVRDPLSGCFALRRSAWRRVAARVDSGGARFLVDLLPAAGALQVREVPVALRSRGSEGGATSLAVRWQLIVSIVRGALRLRLPRRWLSFAGVGALGTVTDALFTGVCIGVGGLAFGVARTIGLAVGMTQNYLLNNRLTFPEAGAAPTLRGWALFGVCQALGALANWGVSVTAYAVGAPWFGALLLGTAAGMALNLAIALKLVWPVTTPAGE